MTVKAKYVLAGDAGYKFNLVKLGSSNYDLTAAYNKDNLPDVEVTRPGIETDLSKLHNRCLLSVNGYFYLTDYTDERLFIPGATATMVKSRSNQVGVLSFNDTHSNLVKTKLTKTMLSKDGDYGYLDKVILTFDHDVEHCMLVLAGYPIFEQEGFLYRISDRSFVLRLDRLSYIDKLYELSRYRNIFDELEIPVSKINPSMIDGNVARSDAVIEKLVDLNNSFMVEFPGHSLQTRKVYLEQSKVPGNVRIQNEPTSLLLGGKGKVIEYKKVEKVEGVYTVHTTDFYMNNHLFSKMPSSAIQHYNDHRVVGNTYTLNEGFFLDMFLTPN